MFFITRQINDYYNGYEFRQQYLITVMSFIKDNFDDYIKILTYFWNIIRNDKLLSNEIGKEQLALGWDGNIVDRVYNQLQK